MEFLIELFIFPLISTHVKLKIFSLVKFGCFNTANWWMLSIDLISNHDHDQGASASLSV